MSEMRAFVNVRRPISLKLGSNSRTAPLLRITSPFIVLAIQSYQDLSMSSPVSTVIGSILGVPRCFRGMRSCPIFSTMMSAVKFPPSNWLIAPQ